MYSQFHYKRTFSITLLFLWGNLSTKKGVQLPETPFLPHTNTESRKTKKPVFLPEFK